MTGAPTGPATSYQSGGARSSVGRVSAVAGVDLLRATDGAKVLEVNSSPGLEGIERVSGEDIAGQIIDYAEARVRAKGEGQEAAVVKP